MSNVSLHVDVGFIGSCPRKVIAIFNQNISLDHVPFERTSTQKTPFIAVDTDAPSDPHTNDAMTIRELIAVP